MKAPVPGRYIVVRNWDKFQHPDVLRREGVPPWIKVYTRLHHNDAWMRLSGQRRAILLGLWIEYAHSRQDLPENTAELSRKLGLRVTTRDLESLAAAGFLELVQAPCKTRREESREEEKRREKNRPDQRRRERAGGLGSMRF